MKLVTAYGEYDLTLRTGAYSLDGSLCVLAEMAGMPFARLTVCLGEQMAKDEACVDVNNCPWVEGFLKNNGLAEPTGRSVFSGFCKYPIYHFNTEKLEAKEDGVH